MDTKLAPKGKEEDMAKKKEVVVETTPDEVKEEATEELPEKEVEEEVVPLNIIQAIEVEEERPEFFDYIVLSTLLGPHGRGTRITEDDLGGFENTFRLVQNGSIAHAHSDAARVALLERSIADAAIKRAEERGN